MTRMNINTPFYYKRINENIFIIYESPQIQVNKPNRKLALVQLHVASYATSLQKSVKPLRKINVEQIERYYLGKTDVYYTCVSRMTMHKYPNN